MARKHNCPHNRTAGGYKRRLQKRGLSRTPMMTPYDADILNRTRAAHQRKVQTGEIWS